MSSKDAPFATVHDLPHYEKRPDAVSAPWMKEEPSNLSGRSHDPETCMPCNSQTAPFATSHNVPRTYEYIGPLPDAPWERDTPVHPSHRGLPQQQVEYACSTPFGTSDNYQHPPQDTLISTCLGALGLETLPTQNHLINTAVVEDKPWDKKLPDPVPSRGMVLEQSKLPSSQTAPFGTSSNLEEKKQYDGPMPNAPWDKDQRPANQQKVSTAEYYKNVPYATSENMEKLKQPTGEVDEAPWNKYQPAPLPSKGLTGHHDTVTRAASHTAPYATFDNRCIPEPNKTKVHQAPWDRDEVHYNRLPARFLSREDNGLFHAPFATDPR